MVRLACVYCREDARNVCNMCYIPYCSKICQCKDWAHHKSICKYLKSIEYIQLKDVRIENEVNITLVIEEAQEDDKPIGSELVASEDPLPVSSYNNTDICVSDFANILSTKTCIFFDALPYVDFPKKPEIQLKVMNTYNLKNSLITVRDYNNEMLHEELEQKLEMMSAECKLRSKQFPNGYAPKYGELCLVLHDADYFWYRAVCFKICPDKEQFYLHFVDYGSNVIVTKSNIIPITVKYLFPTCVHTCRIIDVTDVNKFCRQLAKMKFINCRVKWNDDLKIYDITFWK